MPAIQLLSDPVPGEPALDPAVSRALLDAVAAGEQPETLRLYRPDDVVAFSGLDAGSAGFAHAGAAARAAGFSAALRLAGGRAALFHSGTLAFAWTVPVADLRRGIQERFDAVSQLVADALRRLGVDARVGEVPGEYCPGAHSVNARGRVKLMGVGQRVVGGAAPGGGGVGVEGGARGRAGVAPVDAARGLPFDPATAGAIEDEIGPVAPEAVREALLAELRARGFEPTPAPERCFAALVERARPLAPRFRVRAASFSGEPGG